MAATSHLSGSEMEEEEEEVRFGKLYIKILKKILPITNAKDSEDFVYMITITKEGESPRNVSNSNNLFELLLTSVFCLIFFL